MIFHKFRKKKTISASCSALTRVSSVSPDVFTLTCNLILILTRVNRLMGYYWSIQMCVCGSVCSAWEAEKKKLETGNSFTAHTQTHKLFLFKLYWWKTPEPSVVIKREGVCSRLKWLCVCFGVCPLAAAWPLCPAEETSGGRGDSVCVRVLVCVCSYRKCGSEVKVSVWPVTWLSRVYVRIQTQSNKTWRPGGHISLKTVGGLPGIFVSLSVCSVRLSGGFLNRFHLSYQPSGSTLSCLVPGTFFSITVHTHGTSSA